MPEGNPPFIVSLEEFEDTDALVMLARAIFAARNDCNTGDVDNLLDHPDLQQQFDAILDEIAADPLEDVCAIAVDRGCFGNLATINLVNPVPVRLITGVAIPGHSPRQRERALANRS